MKNIILIGDKKIFAIQVEPGAKPDKNKLCYWVSGHKIGKLTRAADIKSIKKSYQKFKQHHEDYYVSQLEPFHLEQLREFFFEGFFKLVASKVSLENLEAIQRRQKLLLNWGLQVDGYNLILLVKEKNVMFFYTPPGKSSKLDMISYEIFQSVFDEFLSFCDDNNLV